ncbi:hypothetical protein Tco_1234986 [Tanacetum coccineum]
MLDHECFRFSIHTSLGKRPGFNFTSRWGNDPGSLENKILVPEPDSSPCCAKCGTPVDGPYCRGCALLRKKFEEDFLTYCVENGIFQDSQDTSESSDDNTNVINTPREPFVVNQDLGVKFSQEPPQIDHNCYECGDSLYGIFCRQCICKSCGKGAHFGYNCPPKDPIIFKPDPCNQTINEIPQTLPSLDPSCYSLPHVSKPNFVDDPPKVFNLPPQPQFETYSCELCRNNAHYGYDCPSRVPLVYEPEPEVRKKEQAYNEERYSATRRRMLSIPFVDEDDYIPLGDIIARYYTSKAITPDLPFKEPEDSLIMEDEHLDTIPEKESDELIKSSVENLVQNPSESADLSNGESECDVPINDDSPESYFMTFSNPLFDSNDDFSSDDESLSEEEIQKDEFKYFSNPLYDLDDEIITNEKIIPNQKDLDVVILIPLGIDERCFNAESDLLESLLNCDSLIDSTKIDSIFDEFSLPRPLEESNSEYSNATIESLSPSPIPVEDSDPFMEEIDIFLASDDSTPPGVESDYDSEGDILLLEELFNDDLVSLAEYNNFTFDVEPDTSMKNDFDKLNEDECFNSGGGENVVLLNVEDDSITFTIRTFLPFVTYPEVSPLLSSTKNKDTIFDSGIST